MPACAGTATARYSEDLDAIAWYGENGGSETHPLAGKQPNSWGLYDMLGNVWEWCRDVWVIDYTEQSRGRASVGSVSAPRVIRGGSWFDGSLLVRAASRDGYEPPSLYSNLGFRCAEFRQGVVSEARPVSEADCAPPPGEHDPTSAAARLSEDGGLGAQPN